jgi:cytoskeletal protein CcmA (bactofilin family)
MFSRAKTKPHKVGASHAPSILSADLAFTGNLVSDGEIQVDGKVEGDVRCDRLTVGATGHVTGQIFAEYALVRGKVEGRIRAHDVALTRTARVIGDIVHQSLMIEPGAFIEGRCQRFDDVTPEADKKLNLVVAEIPDRTG